MKIKFFILPLLFIIYTCDRQLIAPVRDNPFDVENGLNSGDPFSLQTTNYPHYVLLSWEYTYEKPIPERYILYRINASSIDTFYQEGTTSMIYMDSDVEWDSTYSYYVTAIINDKETSPLEIDNLPAVVRRIVVGEDEQFARIQDAVDRINSGTIYIKEGRYDRVTINNKPINLQCIAQVDKCIIDAKGTESAVKIRNVPDNQIEISGFTLENGNSENGGGIYINNADVIIDSCLIQSNEADSFGGGIYITGTKSNCLISNTEISNNTAQSGGGIYIDGNEPTSVWDPTISTEMNNVNILNNEAHIDNGFGGGIYTKYSENHITGCLIEENKSQYGGGIYFNMAQYAKVNLCSIKNNYAGGFGGAIDAINSTFADSLIITNSEILLNSATYGGALSIRGDDIIRNNNIILFYNNLVVKNNDLSIGTYYGGGFYITDCDNISINYNTVIGNGNSGETISGVNSYGGSIYLAGGEVNIENSIFWNNNASTINEWYLNDGRDFYGEYTIIDSNYNTSCKTGCIHDEPLFMDSENFDFNLAPGSPGEGASNEGKNIGYIKP